MLHPSDATYILPGTNHALIQKPSQDHHRQSNYVKTVVTNASSTVPSCNHAHSDGKPCTHKVIRVRSQPHCFIVDTDSVGFIFDSGSNAVIVQNKNLLTDFRPTRSSVKGVGGSRTAAHGIGVLPLQLQADDGTAHIVRMKAVYVPSSPYNLLPPQLVVRSLRHSGYQASCVHDDALYTLQYSKLNPSAPSDPPKVLTVPIADNDLFMLRHKHGFTKFFQHALSFGSDWSLFSGAAHVIPTEGVHEFDVPREVPHGVDIQREIPPTIPTVEANIQPVDSTYLNQRESSDTTIPTVEANIQPVDSTYLNQRESSDNQRETFQPANSNAMMQPFPTVEEQIPTADEAARPLPTVGGQVPVVDEVDTATDQPNVVSDDEADDEAETSILKSIPLQTDFKVLESPEALYEDPSIAVTRRKQSRLMTIHEKLGHYSFSQLKLLAKAGIIPRDLANVDAPACAGCAYGKQQRRPWRQKGSRKTLRKAADPGGVVSIDQLVSPTKGFVPTHRGRPTTKRYIGATVFVDHASDFTYVHLMTVMNGQSTVEAKRAFERLSASHGVDVKHYHADNGLFDTKVFKADIEDSQQTISFCGPNAHFQNGKAENRIKDITYNARTALLHACHRWPEAVNASLWPAALKNYVNLRNALPRQFKAGRRVGKKKMPDECFGSPLSKFSRTAVEPNLSHFHVFGAPVYVLESKLQEQKSHNKWSDRSRVGIYLCHSPQHASNVPLILNTQSGNVSPQFHTIFDDNFSTCKRDAKFKSLWQLKAKLQDHRVHESQEVSRIDVVPTSPINDVAAPTTPVPINVDLFGEAWNTPTTTSPSTRTEPAPSDSGLTNFEIPSQGDANANVEEHDGTSIPDAFTTPPDPEIPNRSAIAQPVPDSTSGELPSTRSGRQVKPRTRLIEAFVTTFCPAQGTENKGLINTLELLQPDIESRLETNLVALALQHTIAMVSSNSDPDTMTLDEALRQPDRHEFIKAMHKELSDHIQRKHWKVVPLKSIPANKRAIPMVWSMKRKRNPIGEITKWKARLCAGGHRSTQFVDYWSTYSPVVSWSTVRLLVVMALVNNWKMQSIDFVLAFPQAPIQTDIYMKPPKVPPNFPIPDLPFNSRFSKCYKLLQNLYGLCDAGKTWFDYLKAGLLRRGWKVSEVDGCLFTKGDIMLVVYVDDAILISPHQHRIEAEIVSLQKDFDLTNDGPLEDYLGTRFTRRDDGSVELSQTRMIEKVLRLVGLDPDTNRVKMHDTPASDSKLLDQDPSGKPRQQPWNYRAAVGALSYIQLMIRPDITMPVQQCARFCNNPTKEHEEAVKRICRYLLRTKDKGLVLKPDRTKGLECYVDADWAGSWQHRSCVDPLSTHSRTGFVILYAGCPILWGSKMQTLIALSTTEAEYIALSTALREVIGIVNLMEELKGRGFNLSHSTPKVVCRTFEDNQSCIQIATNHRTRPRTKHLSVRLHHFRQHVVKKIITIEHVSTTEQLADMFTKPLPRDQFIKLRNRLMSWPPKLPLPRGSERKYDKYD